MKHTWLLQGAELKYERRAGKYECPTHGKECTKGRVFNVKFSERAGLGDHEPYAYLGCWLKLGEDWDRFPDAESHQKSGWASGQGPSVEEVQTYARAVGWLPPPPIDSGPA